jgi:chromosome segregation ATPase
VLENVAANLEPYATADGTVVSVKSCVNNGVFKEEDAIEIGFKELIQFTVEEHTAAVVADLQAQIASLKDENAELKTRVGKVETENKELKTDNSKKDITIGELVARVSRNETEVGSLKGELKVVKQVVGYDISKKLAEAKMTLKRMVKTDENKEAIYKLKADIEAMESKIFHHVLAENV